MEEDEADTGREDTYLSALQLVQHGVLDTDFLRVRSICRFCRIKDEIVIRYDFQDTYEDGIPAWSAEQGQERVDYRRFVNEIQELLPRFFSAMEVQIAHAVDAAVKEPGKYAVMDGKRATNVDYWAEIRDSLHMIML